MMNKEKLRNIIDTLAQVKYVNRWIIFGVDLFISTFSTLIALFFVSFILREPYAELMPGLVLVVSVSSAILGFLLFHTYAGIIRHMNFVESGRLVAACCIKVFLVFMIVSAYIQNWSLREVILLVTIDGFITFLLLMTMRITLIMLYKYIRNSSIPNKENLLIYGTGNRAAMILNGYGHGSFKNLKGKYRIWGCLSFNENNSIRINGYKVYKIDDQENFNRIVDKMHISAILFPDYQSVKEEAERLVRYCEKKKVRMLTMPPMDEVWEGKTNLLNLPEVRIEDLLGRAEIKINMREIKDALQNKVVLVTGAAGSIGSELCRQLCTFGLKQLVLFDSAETPMHTIRLELEEKYPEVEFTPVMGDVRMPTRVESVFTRFKPQIVFHAAAYKHVPLMEENPCEAVQTNVFGTRTVADLAVKYNVSKFIMISTDKAVNPTNVMGASKRLAEIYVQSLSMAIQRGDLLGKTRFITTRFGNVLGSNGSVIPRFREQLAKGGPITVTHPDIIRYFMTIPEACRLVLEAAFMGKGNEIFVFDMGTPVKIADLAKRMVELAGLIPGEDIEIKYTGLRPGEKLYEELLATKENTINTPNEKIFRAQVREYDYEVIAEAIKQLSAVAASVNKMETVKIMKNLVPEFKSQQSEYEALDKEPV